MIWNYMKIAVRNIMRHKGFTLLNLASLALGMTCCLLIVLWIQDDFTFDRFHKNGDNIYAVVNKGKYGDRFIKSIGAPPALANALETEYADIVKATRVLRGRAFQIRHGSEVFRQPFYAVDPQFLDMFSFGLEAGDRSTALDDPNSILITREISRRLFGDANPVGHSVEIDNRFSFTVTGILEKVPANSSFRFDCLIPFSAMEMLWDSPGYLTQWTNWNSSTFVMTAPGADPARLSKLIENRINEARGKQEAFLSLKAFEDIYLYGIEFGDGRFHSIFLWALLGMFILGIACINYMNLATARSTLRAKEIGLRKVIGASRKDIIFQFYGEALVLSLIALGISLILVQMVLPYFNAMIGRHLDFSFNGSLRIPLAAAGVTILTALTAGSYPALLMSSFKPVSIIAGNLGIARFKSRFRKGLVIWQYAVSIVLVVITVVIYDQASVLLRTDVGLDRDNIVYVPLNGTTRSNCLAYKQQASSHPGVIGATLVSSMPTGIWTNGNGWQWEGRDEDTDPLTSYLFADKDCLEVLGIDLAAGRYFTEEQTGGNSFEHKDILVNETFAQLIGGGNKETVGRTISTSSGESYRIIGVLKDFHFKSLFHPIEPLILFQNGPTASIPQTRYKYLFLRIDPAQTAGIIKHLSAVTTAMEPGFPFEYGFLEERYEQLYKGIGRWGDIMSIAASLMVFISCLGLFALAAYTAEQRRREVGIRKVLGASETGLVRFLSLEMLRPVFYACVIGSVAAYLLVKFWALRRVQYDASPGWIPFAVANGLAIGVALLSVITQALRAARSKLIEVLRYE